MDMANEPAIASEEMIPMVHFIRGKRVMLDFDLARIYGVTTGQMNQALKRNRDRFPEDFAFQLERQEVAGLISQIVISKNGRGGRRKMPWVFTEHGAIMLATILNSKRAVEMSVFVVRTFGRMREILAGNEQLARKLAELESRVGEHDESLKDLFEAIRQLLEPATPEKKREIGFHIKEQAARYKTRNGN